MLDSCMRFGGEYIWDSDIEGKSVLEVGSGNVNGSLRPVVEEGYPGVYVGTDIEEGPGVDVIVAAGDLLKNFGPDSFDAVICTEVLEHIEDWREAIHNLKGVCRPGGMILLTTRSPGFPVHDFPADYWRFTVFDMQAIFSDCEIERLEMDLEAPGVFVKVRKPADFKERDLAGISAAGVQQGAA